MVIGASTDKLEDAQKMVSQYHLTFPIAYGLDASKIAAVTGAFFNEGKQYLHATGFIIGPDNRITVAVYSTGAIGRLTPQDCLRTIDFQSRKLNKQ